MENLLTKAGTTVCLALLHGDKILVANSGDSRAVLYDSTQKDKCFLMSYDHKPEVEKEK